MPTWAAVGVAAIGAGSSIIGGQQQAGAAQDASQAQLQGAREAIQFNRDALAYTTGASLPDVRSGASARARQMLMAGISPDEVRRYLGEINALRPFNPGYQPTQATPYRATGRFGAGNQTIGPVNNAAPTSAGPVQTAAQGGDSLDWIDNFDAQEFLRATPGYEFRLDEGVRARERGASARGRLFSGATDRELTRYGQGLADEYWGDLFNEYGALSGTGQTAQRDINQNVTQFGQTAGDISQTAGRARASGYLGAANAYGDMLTGINNAIGTGVGLYGRSQGWY